MTCLSHGEVSLHKGKLAAQAERAQTLGVKAQALCAADAKYNAANNRPAWAWTPMNAERAKLNKQHNKHLAYRAENDKRAKKQNEKA